MAGGIIAAAITAHVPRMGIEDKAPDFQRGLIAGSKAMGEALRGLKPDLFVLQSAHWVSSFNWYVTSHALHKGYCVADEAPDLIPGLPYERKGDPVFARALADAMKAEGMPAFTTDNEHRSWDYACWVPMVYLDPQSSIPLIELPTCLAADHAENMKAGRLVHEVAKKSGRRVVFLASSALTHKIARGPHLWPSDERLALDRDFIAGLAAGDVDRLSQGFAEYSQATAAEMGGRVIATLLGGLGAMRADYGPLSGRQYGDYAQSSGSGNVNVAVQPTAH